MSPHGSRPDRRGRLVGGTRAWARRHAYSLLSSLGGLLRQPLGSLMTIIVLAVTLCLPTGLHLALDNAERASAGWERLDTLSVFLDQQVDEREAMQLASLISTWPGVTAVDPISPQSGLAELAGQLALGEITDRVGDNPLPWVLEITPGSGVDPVGLSGRLGAVNRVEQVIVDLEWLARFDAILALLERLAVVLGALFAVAVAFVIGNTIRMDIHNRREEIQVLALVGATDGFIRRPFLYSGLWYGLAGGLLAWLIIEAGLWVLSGPVARMSESYASDFRLASAAVPVVALLVLGSGLLGVLGSWLTVGRHLKRIHPA